MVSSQSVMEDLQWRPVNRHRNLIHTSVTWCQFKRLFESTAQRGKHALRPKCPSLSWRSLVPERPSRTKDRIRFLLFSALVFQKH